jgi:hypothetical protein
MGESRYLSECSLWSPDLVYCAVYRLLFLLHDLSGISAALPECHFDRRNAVTEGKDKKCEENRLSIFIICTH